MRELALIRSFLAVSVAITFFLSVGDAFAQSSVKLYGVWNGFNNHSNIIECLNPSSSESKGNFSLSNSAQLPVGDIPFRIPAHGTLHTSLNNLSIANDYGLFEIKLASGHIPFCYTVIYRPGREASDHKQIQYAFTLPAGKYLLGDVAGTYNSMNPEGDAQPVYNWLSIYNISSSALSADIQVFHQDGTLDHEQSTTIKGLPPGARRDIALGHELGQRVGLYRIVPIRKTQAYGAFLSRFSLNADNRYNFSFPLIPSTGSCDTGPIPTSTMGPAQNWLEISNVSDRTRQISIELRLRDGTLLLNESASLAAHSQKHINANSYLGANAIGWFRVRCKTASNANAIIAQSLFYGVDPTSPGRVAWAYASQGNPGAKTAKTFVSAFNTFLSAANWLKVLNPITGSGSVEVGLFDINGNAVVNDLSFGGGKTALDLDIHSAVGANTFGYATTTLSTATFPQTELIRVFPTSSGGIGYIMNIPSFPAQIVKGDARWFDEFADNSNPPGGTPGGSTPGSTSGTAPVAQSATFSTPINTSKSFTLHATDTDSANLRYSIVTPPAHGKLSGTAPHLTYTPHTGYFGSDRLTFRASDGSHNSKTATVNITVTTLPGTCGSLHLTFPGFTPGDFLSGATSAGILYEDGKTAPIGYNADITFYFDKPYPCGQFVTGDWWVKGPITVTRMTPDNTSNRNGYDVNPLVDHQSFDSRIAGYEAISESLPLTLDPTSGTKSLLKAVSYNPNGECQTIVQGHNLRSCLLSVAILTVLKDEPTELSFRPPYINGSKPLVPFDALDVSKLPRLPRLAESPKLIDVKKSFGGPYIDHITDWVSRFIHPRANMHDTNPMASVAYGSRLATVINNAVLSTLHDDPNSEKEQVAIPLTQWGIDLYHQLRAGQTWPENGGHDLGRKLPILYAGLLLSSELLGDAMLNMAYTYHDYGTLLASGEGHKNYFQEDGGIYYGKNGIALFGGSQGSAVGTFGGGYSYNQKLTSCNGSRTAREPNGTRDGAVMELDHSDPNTTPTWLTDYLADFGPGGRYVDADNPPVQVVDLVRECSVYNVELPTVAQQLASGKAYASPYQDCCTSKQYVYTATAAKLLGLKEQWNHPAFFDYVERWMSPPWNGRGGYGSAYGDAMFIAYYNPRTYNQTVMTTRGVATPVTLVAVDAQNDPLLYSVVSGPSHGTLSSVADGDKHFTYTSDTNFTGTDTFTFRVSDGVDHSNVSTVTVVVNSDPNDNITWSDNFNLRTVGTTKLDDQQAADQLLWTYLKTGKATIINSLGSPWLRMSNSVNTGDIFVVGQPTFSNFQLEFDIQKPWTSGAGFAFHVQDDRNFYYMSISPGLTASYPGAVEASGGLYKVVNGTTTLVASDWTLRVPHHGGGLVDHYSVHSTIVGGQLRFEVSRTEQNYGTGATYSAVFTDPSPSFSSGKCGFLSRYEQWNVALYDNVIIQEDE